MRKIITLGLSVLTGSVLAFGSPMAAHAATTNKDALCAAGALPLTIANLNTQVANATTAHNDAVTAQGTKSTTVVTAAHTLATAAAAYINALDGTGNVAATQGTFNAASTAFSTAVSDWQTSYLAAVTAQNILYGSNFLLEFDHTVVTALPCP